MDDQWDARSKQGKKEYLNLAQALYADQPTEIAPVAPKRPKAARKPTTPSEAIIQTMLVTWARKQGLPLISIPNAGVRSRYAGHKEVQMGLTKGVSDLFLARPSGAFHGMWIELKSQKRLPTMEQYDWLQRMIKEGYHAVWFDNFDEAQAAIVAYLAASKPW
jgi:hypothetical protein